MRSLREDGWRLVREGKTTIDEVVSNTMEEQAALAIADAIASPSNGATNGTPHGTAKEAPVEG